MCNNANSYYRYSYIYIHTYDITIQPNPYVAGTLSMSPHGLVALAAPFDGTLQLANQFYPIEENNATNHSRKSLNTSGELLNVLQSLQKYMSD